MKKYQYSMLKDERWWGGKIKGAEKMPFDESTELTIDLADGRGTTASAPFFLSDKGRFIWSEKGFALTFNKGVIEITAEAEVILDEEESTLRGAFLRAKKLYFPYKGEIHTAREFYSLPQFNTWMELIKNQTQDNILAYATALIENGYKPGLLMIDDGWQKEHGTWRFDAEKFYDPKGMIEKLHAMGFKVMLWVSPYVSLSSDDYLSLATKRGIEGDDDHLVRLKDGRVAIHKWWNGYCAMLNFNLEGDCEYMQKQLDTLVNEFGVDGFKFDGGDYTWHPVNEVDYYADRESKGESVDYMEYGWRPMEAKLNTVDELNLAWIKFGMRYPLHEYKNTWKVGHLPVIERLYDKAHRWEGEGLDCLIPHGIFFGLIGNPFVCPDMVGGGVWTAFVYGKADEELFVRSAQCSALFPMIQFSAAPWRILSKEYADLCLDAAKIHESARDRIVKCVEEAEKTGEPILRNMEYQYPHCGYHGIKDQFMLGDDLLVAPVVEKGATTRKVVFPEGKWKDTTDGVVYEGGRVIEVPAPIDKLPYFERIR